MSTRSALSSRIVSLPAGRHACRFCCQPRICGRYYRPTLTVGSFKARVPLMVTGIYRSRMFSLALGLIFVGFAVGPLIGGVTIRMTGSTLSVFYLAATLHSIYILLLVFVLPESLTKVRAHNARLRHKAEKEMNMGASTGSRILKDVTRFLDAMAVLRPRDTIDGNPLRRHKKDWSLFLVAICYATSTSVVVSVPCAFHRIILKHHSRCCRLSCNMVLQPSLGRRRL